MIRLLFCLFVEAIIIGTGFFFRFFIAAPLLATIVLLRSPRGIKKDRWIAWRLVRAHRLGRTLSIAQMSKLNDALTKELIREIRVPMGVDHDQLIQWGPSIELVPIKELEVRA
ncbi:MAG: hypothetical protein ACJKSS_00155 [Patescibacteria group bacterium UBA2103]